jgi:hypothetical protein
MSPLLPDLWSMFCSEGADDRFAIANVDDEVVISLEPRLRRMNELMGV